MGPSAEVLTLTGNKARAIAAAKAAGIPTLQSVPPSTDVDALVAAAEAIPAPLFAEGALGLAHAGLDRLPQLRPVVHAAQAAAATTGDRLHLRWA